MASSEPGDAPLRAGPYRVGARLGSGAMGAVHRARDLLDGRTVALKLHRKKGEDQALRRFLQEARALGVIDHPGVARVYDAGRDGELLWIAMELVEGRPLTQVLEPGPLPWADALSLFGPLVEAVASAHAAGVMHRDIKPANVIVLDGGAAKLVDFGLAKRIGEIPQAAEAGETVWDWKEVHTAPGAVLGTPAYMSPEQARAQSVDARADVFALGVMIWEALVGQPLFRRATAAATIRAIVTEAAPRLDETGHVSSPIADVVARALENDPARRFRDAGALAEALRALPHPSQPPRPSRITGRIEAGRPPLVGRDRELSALVGALRRRDPDVAVVGGPATGKRTLVRAALDQLGETKVVTVSRAEVPPADSLEGVRVVVVHTPHGDLAPLRAAIAEHAPRATLVRVGPRWAGAGASTTITLGALTGDDAVILFSAVEEPRARAIAEALGGHPLALGAIRSALDAGTLDLPRLEAELRVPDLLPDALAPLRTRARDLLDTSPSGGPALGVLARLPWVDVETAAALLGTSPERAAQFLETLVAWSLAERDGACVRFPAITARLLPPPTEAEVRGLGAAITILVERARRLVLDLDRGGGVRAFGPLVALLPILERAAATALALGAPELVQGCLALAAPLARTGRPLPALVPLLHAAERLGTPRQIRALGHVATGTVAQAAHALALAGESADVLFEASLTLGRAGDVRAMAQSIELARLSSEPGVTVRAQLAAAECAWSLGDASGVRRAIESARAAAMRDPSRYAGVELRAAELALAMGDDEGALPPVKAALEAARSVGRARVEAQACAHLAELALRNGELEDARAHLAAAAHALFPERSGRLSLLGAQIALVLGETVRAATLARAARELPLSPFGVAVSLAVEASATGVPAGRALDVALEGLAPLEVAVVRGWLGGSADASTVVDLLALPPRSVVLPGTSLMIAVRRAELGARTSRRPLHSRRPGA